MTVSRGQRPDAPQHPKGGAGGGETHSVRDSTRARRQTRNAGLIAKLKHIGWTLDPGTGCLLWRGATNEWGYGVVNGGSARMLAHRLALEMTLERSLGAGMLALHSCDREACCNPLHLREGTPLDNMRDRMERTGYFGATATHCSHGHEYDPENTRVYLEADGRLHRRCRACRRAQYAARRSQAVVST